MKKHFIVFETLESGEKERIGDGFAEDAAEAKRLALKGLKENEKFVALEDDITVEECIGGCIICTPNEAGK